MNGCYLDVAEDTCNAALQTVLTNQAVGWRHVALDTALSILYFCDLNPKKKEVLCYSSVDGATWIGEAGRRRPRAVWEGRAWKAWEGLTWEGLAWKGLRNALGNRDARACVCVDAYLYVCIYVYAYAYAYRSVCVCAYVYAYMCACVCVLVALTAVPRSAALLHRPPGGLRRHDGHDVRDGQEEPRHGQQRRRGQLGHRGRRPGGHHPQRRHARRRRAGQGQSDPHAGCHRRLDRYLGVAGLKAFLFRCCSSS